MLPSNRQEFYQRIKQNLGHPVIQINVTDEQISNKVDEALYEFYKRHNQAVENVYLIATPTDNEVAKGFMILPEDILGISEVYRINNVSSIWSIDYQYQMAELYSLSNVMRHGGINYYYTQKMHLELLNQLFSPDRTVDFNPITHKLIFAGGLKDLRNTEGSVIIKCFRRISGDFENADTNETLGNIWKVQWLIDFATAKLKYQWGQNLGKYQNIQMLGGVMMNGGEIKAEAKVEIEELLQELKDEYELPIDFIVG